MSINKSDSSNLAYAQNVIVSEIRYAMEHNPCMINLSEKFNMPKGSKSITVPKMSALGDAVDLVEGEDMASPSSLTMNYVSLTTAEIGIKAIVTDRLIRQMSEDVFRMVGKLLGDSMVRKLDKDGLAMLDGFSTALGAAGTTISTGYLAAAVTRLEATPAPKPYAFVHHPYAIRRIMDAVAVVGTYPLPQGFSADLLRDYWKGSLVVYGLPIFANGNLTPDSSDDVKGGLFSKSALGYVVAQEPYTENDRDISLRAYEIVHVCDADWTELNDTYGLEMLFDAATPSA